MLKSCDKILIIGCAGSGKTTLAKKIHLITGLPIIHMDKYYWTKHWTPKPDAQWNEIVQQLCKQPQWIMDGNYTKTMAYRFKQANLVIYLDMPRWRCLLRVIIRRLIFLFNSRRDDIPYDCKEKINFRFYNWIWNYPQRSRNQALAMIKKYPGPAYHLRSNAEICNLLESLKTVYKHKAC